MIKSFWVPALIVGLVLVGFQQRVDPEFDAKVARPAYTTTHPKVLIDEAYKNFHTAGRGYKPFADLMTSDGYQVLPNKEMFQESALKGVDVLVIANALGAGFFDPDAGKPAFTDAECDVVRDWVQRAGESPLDHEVDLVHFGGVDNLAYDFIIGLVASIQALQFDAEPIPIKSHTLALMPRPCFATQQRSAQ